MEYTIKTARLAAGLTQQEMSDRLGIPKRSIENWEGGQRHPAPWAEKLIIEKLLLIAKEEGKDPFYSNENQNRLRKSIEKMEKEFK